MREVQRVKLSSRWWRLATGLAIGALVTVLVVPIMDIWTGLLCGWAASATTVVTWVLLATWPMDGEQTRAHATREDPGRRVARMITLICSVASLGAVVVVLVSVPTARPEQQAWMAAIVVAAVVASWFLVQVDAMLRYARMYYSEKGGGIDFNQSEPPSYADFAYVSFGLGLTYQVADTDVQNTTFRRAFVVQSLLGYLFGAVILATIINLISSLG